MIEEVDKLAKPEGDGPHGFGRHHLISTDHSRFVPTARYQSRVPLLKHFPPLSPQPGGGVTGAACVPVMNPMEYAASSSTR